MQKAYWVEFDIDKTSKTNSGWSILIPRINEFNAKSKSELVKVAGESVDYMSQIEYHWEVNNQIKKSGLVMLNVSKEEVMKLDTSGFKTLLDRLTINDEMIAKSEGKLSFLIDGYNDDTREIYEIPEIRNWIRKVFHEFKYWGYFLNMSEDIANLAGLRLLVACLIDVKIVGENQDNTVKHVQYDIEQAIELMVNLYDYLNDFSDKYGISKKINKRKSDEIRKIIFPQLV